MLMICKATSLGMLCLMKMIFLAPPSCDEKIYYDDGMPPIYDDYCDDMYAIKSDSNHETCHHDFNIECGYVNQVSHDSYFIEFAPTTMDEKEFANVESNENSMLVHHEKNDLCDGYIVEFLHDATENLL